MAKTIEVFAMGFSDNEVSSAIATLGES